MRSIFAATVVSLRSGQQLYTATMSKKKQQRNGFYYYMLDMQQDLRERGRFVPMRDMPLLAGPSWSKLSDGQKQAYNQRAKHEKRGGIVQGGSSLPPAVASMPLPASREGRMDCTGVLLSERHDLAAEMEERRRHESELIRASFPPGKAVSLTKFYLVDIQSLCEIPDKKAERFLPCELAAIEFSLHSGVHKSLHKFIHPGKIPMGYRFLAKNSSEQTHEIPIEGFELAEKDYRLVLSELERFLCPDGTQLPPVFAKRDNAERVEWCLQWLADKAGVENLLHRVYEVEALLCELSTHLDGRAPTLYQAQDLLKTSVYDHERGTRCGWHEERENKHCSLGTVNIYSFVLSESLCPKYGISLTKNHLPETPSDPPCNVVNPRTATPSLSPSSRTITPSPAFSTGSLSSFGSLPDQFGQLSVGGGRGRGRGFAYGAVRQPKTVGGLQQSAMSRQ